MEIKNPHDKLFRSYFGQKEHFQALLVQVLPPQVIQLLDTETLELENGTQIDPDHREHFSDLSASVHLAGRPWKIYILVEHKSYHDPFAPLQILRYMVQQWDQDSKEHPKAPLTPILPILFYHGPKRQLLGDFKHLFPKDLPPELQAYLPDYQCQVFNLSTLPDTQLESDPLTTSVLWSLKYAWTQATQVLKALDRLVDTLGEAALKNPDFQALELYILTSSTLTPEEMLDKINISLRNYLLKEDLMSTYQALIEKGKAEGISIGKIEGKIEGIIIGEERGISIGEARGKHENTLEIARKLKEQRVALDVIATVTGLSLAEIQAL